MLGKAPENTSRTSGVGFIVKAALVPLIISCDILPPRVAVLKLKVQRSGKRTLKIVQVHAPTLLAEDDEVERFYEEMETALDVKSTYTIVQGDFNAIVGPRSDQMKRSAGNFGVVTRNDTLNSCVRCKKGIPDTARTEGAYPPNFQC
ncbi:Craniofacial development protein 2 [Toxocara canis]|uniref:Craniofacial development protein 2 n=1 Tax=Toxocara canis TaxID=6265 RepID=A0A0B2UU95_TOXCA|nr:Craniofacial development protein 2 [Toxocara canis]